MKQNNSLLVAYRFLQFCFGFSSLLFVVFLIVMIMGLTDSPFVQQISIPDAGRPGVSVSLNWCKGDCAENLNPLSSLDTGMIWWILIRTSTFFTLSLLIIYRGMVLLHSILNGNTFYDGNIRTFSELAKYGLIIALISAFNFRMVDGFDLTLSVPFAPLLFALGCKVLAEIFKQGKLLSEENQSFV